MSSTAQLVQSQTETLYGVKGQMNLRQRWSSPCLLTFYCSCIPHKKIFVSDDTKKAIENLARFYLNEYSHINLVAMHGERHNVEISEVYIDPSFTEYMKGKTGHKQKNVTTMEIIKQVRPSFIVFT